jgi:hypothetical protein
MLISDVISRRLTTGHGRDTANGRYGFVWQQTKGKGELLPFLDRFKIDITTSGRGINDSGFVTGFTTGATGAGDGFVGGDASGYQRLVAPGGEVPGNSTVCQGINNLAQVVCVVNDPSGHSLAAFIAPMAPPAVGPAEAPCTASLLSRDIPKVPGSLFDKRFVTCVLH